MASQQQTYRPDIDGLRGFSILIALIYHGFEKALPGGFIGADIFFVISGYLITGQIYDATRTGRFSFLDFYSRRIRRIFPPLILMLVFVGIYGYLRLNLSDFTSLFKHIAGGSVFISNFVLWNEIGYFDQHSALKPLLHLWSLAIEEQFYVLWPLLVFALAVAARRIVGILSWSLALVCVGSFFARMQIAEHDAIAAFYSPLTRFWELGIGGLLAVLEINRADIPSPRWSNLARNIAATAGTICLAICAFLLSGHDHFQTLLATLPALSALALIAAGPNAFINRHLLCNKPMIELGMISYALYLWHWPLMSFMRIEGGGHAPHSYIWLALGISFVLAILTRSLVEQPIRRMRAGWVPVALAITFIGIGLTGLAGYKSTFFRPERLQLQAQIQQQVEVAMHEFNVEGLPFTDCASLLSPKSVAFQHCRIGGDPKASHTIAVWGDSMSTFWSPPFLTMARDHGWRIIQFSHFDCPAIIGVYRIDWPNLDCNTPEMPKHIMQAIRTARPDVVFLIGRWNFYYHGNIKNDVLVDRSFITDGTGEINADTAKATFERYFPQTVRLLAEHSRVVIFKDTPVMKVHVSVGASTRPDSYEPITTEYRAFEAGINRVIDDTVANVEGTVAFDPSTRLCDASKCSGYLDGLPAYVDEVHLTAHAAMKFLPDIEKLAIP